MLLSTTGDTVRPLAGLTSNDRPQRWSPDGRAVWVTAGDGWDAVAVDIATGARVPLLTGVGRDLPPEWRRNRIVLADDPSRYAYARDRRASDLFVVEGAR